MKKAGEILNDAAKLIDTRGKERDKDDGERSMERCVKSFNAMTDHNLTETEGWKFMMFLKMARMEGGAFKFDDYEDNVSYSGLMAESALKENQPVPSIHELTFTKIFPTVKSKLMLDPNE